MATGPHVAMIPMMEISDEFQPEGRFASPSANIPLRQRFWRKDRINGDRLGRPESALGGERRHHSMRHAEARGGRCRREPPPSEKMCENKRIRDNASHGAVPESSAAAISVTHFRRYCDRQKSEIQSWWNLKRKTY